MRHSRESAPPTSVLLAPFLAACGVASACLDTRSAVEPREGTPLAAVAPPVPEELDVESARAEDVVFGVRYRGDAVAVTEARLIRDGVVRARVAGEGIALLRNSETGEVRAVLEGERELEPVLPLGTKRGVEPTKKVRDRKTRETIAIVALEELRVDRSRLYAWVRAVPGSRVLMD